MSKASVIWFTGLSGAGKTTITEALLPELRARGEKLPEEFTRPEVAEILREAYAT